MGLDFRWREEPPKVGERPHWSYSGFMAFRTRLAEAVGLRLDAMDGFGGAAKWPQADDEPIVLLLNHSDCDGELTASQCAHIAPRLRQLLAAWPDDDYDKRHGSMLAEAMEECAAEHLTLLFC